MLLEVLKFDDEGGHGSIVFVAGDDDGRVSHVVHERVVAEGRRVRGPLPRGHLGWHLVARVPPHRTALQHLGQDQRLLPAVVGARIPRVRGVGRVASEVYAVAEHLDGPKGPVEAVPHNQLHVGRGSAVPQHLYSSPVGAPPPPPPPPPPGRRPELALAPLHALLRHVEAEFAVCVAHFADAGDLKFAAVAGAVEVLLDLLVLAGLRVQLLTLRLVPLLREGHLQEAPARLGERAHQPAIVGRWWERRRMRILSRGRGCGSRATVISRGL